MSFSDKMRDSLGAEGAQLEVAPPKDPTAPGATGVATITIVGGTRAARVDALIVKLIEADRHWTDASGKQISEADAPPREERKGLTAGWSRTPIAEQQVDVGHTIEPGQRHEISVDVHVPSSAKPSSAACSHTLNVQADIKGQIDPTGNARIEIG